MMRGHGILRWPTDACDPATRIESAWDRKWSGEMLEILIYCIRHHIPGPDVWEHPDNEEGTDLYGGECFCQDCMGNY